MKKLLLILIITCQLSITNSSAQLIAGGDFHSLAVCNDSTAWAWGFNIYGQLGTGNNTNSNVPVQTSSLTGVVAISGGAQYSIALKNDGTVWAWGRNLEGQLGNGNNTDSHVPVQTSSLTGVVAIAGGGVHSLALKSDGTVWAWGYNSSGQLGNGNNTPSNVPVQVSGLCPVLTGMEEENIISTIHIFPNPATTQLTIDNGQWKIERVEIYDVTGREVYSENHQTPNSNSETILDVSKFPDGVYVVRIQTTDFNETKKLIVAK